jgi:hypothetical protein
MNMKITFVIIVFAAFSAIAVAPARSQNKSILQLADEYSLALKKYERQKSRASVESVVRKGKAVGEKLYDMESLSDADYALLEKKMRGFVVNREEILYINPDLKFFERLAKLRGTQADASFFALMRQIRPNDVWAAYIEQQTDVTGCGIYGNGALTRLYGKALQFKKTYPKAYVSDINKEISEILEELNEGTCACGTRAGVEKEFRAFIKAFPNDKNTPAIKKRLANLKKNKDFRFNCQSG